MTENIKSQMRKGMLEYCILSIIDRQEAYTSDIADTLKKADLLVVEGTLYPLPPQEQRDAHISLGGKHCRTAAQVFLSHRHRATPARPAAGGMEIY